MKIVNIILSILILLLSAAAATFSYFLFEKRSQFVTGWGKMANAISQSAAELDKNSGTELAKTLTASAMAHENFAKLDSLLPELPKRSKEIIVQRDALADALSRVSSAARMEKQIGAEKLRNINSYGAARNEVVSGVRDVVSRRDRTYGNLTSTAKNTVGVSIRNDQLLKGDPAAFDEFKAKLREIYAQKSFYEQRLKEISRSFGGSVNPDAKNYRAEIDKIRASILAYQRATAQTKRDLDSAKREIRNKTNQIAALNRNIQNLKGQVADREAQIVSFQRAFGLPSTGADAQPWKPGAPETRAKLEGKVIAVNLKYGYIAINFGKYSVVRQNIGNRVLEINPVIEPGLTMMITRKNGAKSDFITKVVIAKVGETSSIATIPVDAKPIQVGDIVTVAMEDLPQPEAPKAAAKGAAKR